MKFLFSLLFSFICIISNAQYLPPSSSNPTFLNNRNIVVDDSDPNTNDNMTPVAIARYGYDKFAVTFYSKNWVNNHISEVRFYNSISDFENNVNYTVSANNGTRGVEALEFDNQGHLFIMATESDAMQIYNPNTNSLSGISKWDIDARLSNTGTDFWKWPRGMCWDNGSLYLADDGNDRILKISNINIDNGGVLVNNYVVSVVCNLPIGSSPKSVKIIGNRMFISCFGDNHNGTFNTNNAIKVFDMTTNQFLMLSNPLGTNERPLDFTAQYPYLYCSVYNSTNNTGKVIRLDTNLVVKQTYSDFGGSNGPWGMCFSSVADLYCTDGSNDRIVKYTRTRSSDAYFTDFQLPYQIGSPIIDTAKNTVKIVVSCNHYYLGGTSVLWTTNSTAHCLNDFAAAYDFSSGSCNFTIEAEDGTKKVWTVYVRKQSTENNILTFSAPNTIGTASITKDTIYLNFSSDVNLTNIIPTFTLSSGAISYPASGTAMNLTLPQIIDVRMECGPSYHSYYVIAKVIKSSAKDILAFSLPNMVGNAVIGASDVNVVVSNNTDLTNLAPAITISPKASINPGNGVVQNFTNPVKYTLIAEDGSFKEYTIKITKQSNASIQNLHSFHITFYPNPAKDLIEFQSSSKIAGIEISNLQGMMFTFDERQIKNNKLDISMLPKGIYVLKATDVNQNETHCKLLKD